MAYTLEDIEKKKREYDKALESKPSAFYSNYQSLRDDVLKQIAERKDFSYNPLSDEVYNLYKDRYAYEGSRAMKDTVSSASALTGGYANSYAVRAGAEAYNDYIKKSTDVIPELYSLALERYKLNSEHQDDLYSYYSGLYDDDVKAYEGLWDRYYKDISESETAYKTAKDSYDNDLKLKLEEKERKAEEEAERKRLELEERELEFKIAEAERKAAEEEAERKAAAEIAARKAVAAAEEATKITRSSKSSSSKSSGDKDTEEIKVVKRETEAIKSFKSSLLSKAAFNRSLEGRLYSSYNDYVRKNAQSWYKDGRLTDGELNYIKDMFVLR